MTLSDLEGETDKFSGRYVITLIPPLGVKKTRRMGLLGRERNLTISSTVWIQYTNVLDKWTDGQTECLSCTVSEIDGENCKFLTPVYLTLPLKIL